MKLISSAALAILLLGCNNASQNETVVQNSTPVTVIGEMKNVMRKGQLQGTIDLDTIKNKTHLYGFGPKEFLKGEILVLDGKSYQSIVVNDSVMKVSETFELKAPFFAYTNIDQWEEYSLPDSVIDLRSLENHLIKFTSSKPQPLFFKLEGNVDSTSIHIVSLPDGIQVRSPQDAHQGRVFYPLKNENATIVGFYSQNHQAIFTHHDTFLHMHLITNDRSKMGHVDELNFKSSKLKLFLPKP